MSWPQWSSGTQPPLPAVLNPSTPVINSAPAVVPPGLQYTPDQWAQLQQQNWHQWAQWQQQYQQWHQQYGAEYQKSINALNAQAAQQSVAALPNVGVPPPLPNENKPPLPLDDPPPNQAYSTMPPNQLPNYSTAPPPKPAQIERDPLPKNIQNQSWQNQNQAARYIDNSHQNKRPFEQDSDRDSKRQMINKPGWQNHPPPQTQPHPQPVRSNIVKDNIEELSEAEKKFDKQFADWEAQFNKWKEQNAEHPDKEQYREYEKKWETWRAQLLERREQMKRKRLGLTSESPNRLRQQTYNQPKVAPSVAQNPPSKAAGLLPTPSVPLNKPPPNLNDEPLKFKQNKPFPDVNESAGDFLKTSSSGGIPGLDLVRDDPKGENEDVIIVEGNAEKKGPDFDAISKGINTILGDQKLLSMLSMVSQNQNLQTSDNLTNTTSRIKDASNPERMADPFRTSYNEQSNLSHEDYSNQSEGYAQREFVNNFDDQTRSSFTMAHNDPDNRYEGNNFGRNQKFDQNQFPNRFGNFDKNNRFGGGDGDFNNKNNFGRNDFNPDRNFGLRNAPGFDRFGPRGDNPERQFGGNLDRQFPSGPGSRGEVNLDQQFGSRGDLNSDRQFGRNDMNSNRQFGPRGDMSADRQFNSRGDMNIDRQFGPRGDLNADRQFGPRDTDRQFGSRNDLSADKSFGLRNSDRQFGSRSDLNSSRQFGPRSDTSGFGSRKSGDAEEQFGPRNDNFDRQFGPNGDNQFGPRGELNPDRPMGPRNDGNFERQHPKRVDSFNRGQFGRDEFNRGGNDFHQNRDNFNRGSFNTNAPLDDNYGDNFDYDASRGLPGKLPDQDGPLSSNAGYEKESWAENEDYPDDNFREPVESENIPTASQDEILKPTTVIDYDHKSLKSVEPEILIEPIHMFDYRHKPLSRIPLPQRPKWLSETVKNIREFDPPVVRPYEPPNLRRYPSMDSWRSERTYDNYQDSHWSPHNRRGYGDGRFEERRPYSEGRPSSYDDSKSYKDERNSDERKRDEFRKSFNDGRSSFHDERNPQFKDERKSQFKDERSPHFRDRDERSPHFKDENSSFGNDGWKNDHDKPSDTGSNKYSNRNLEPSRNSPFNKNENSGNKANPVRNVVLIEDIINPPGRYNRPPRIVIILRGPPGSGKTFLAKLIKDKEVENGGSTPRILSLDDYFMVEQEKEVTEEGRRVKVKEMVYEYEAEMEESYRSSLIKSFKKTITDGYFSFIIVDNVNDKVKYFGEMWSFAKQNGFQVYICQLDLDVQTCSKRNIHGRSEADIEKCVTGWEATPSHHPVLDATSLIQSGSIPEVEMEEVNSPETDACDDGGSEDQVTRSKWDNFDCSVDNLAKLDGVSKPLRPSRTMEEYLQLETEWTPAKPTKPGQKRVRWADLEEQKQQEKMRAIGFVVGQTNWDRMMDPTMGSSALTQTKYIERTGRY